jgi:hypothetical protein
VLPAANLWVLVQLAQERLCTLVLANLQLQHTHPGLLHNARVQSVTQHNNGIVCSDSCQADRSLLGSTLRTIVAVCRQRWQPRSQMLVNTPAHVLPLPVLRPTCANSKATALGPYWAASLARASLITCGGREGGGVVQAE